MFRRLGCGARRALTTSAPLIPPAPASGRALPTLTICLDLDETLVHSTTSDPDAPGFQEMSGPEIARAKAAQANLHGGIQLAAGPADHEINLVYVDAPVRLYKRPLLDDFLLEASKLGQLVLFSSGATGRNLPVCPVQGHTHGHPESITAR